MISRLAARLDLEVVLSDGKTVRLRNIAPSSVRWRRNLPAVADELSVTCGAAYLPLDLRACRAIRVWCWLFEHQDMERCAAGDPGCFAGFADEVARNRLEQTVTLRCRDWTAGLLDAHVGATALKRLDLRRLGTLSAVVQELVRLGPEYARSWKVRSLSEAGKKVVFAALAQAPGVRGVRGGRKSAPGEVFQRRMDLAAFADGEEASLWEVVVQVSARMGVVPELALNGAGDPEIMLVDALDLQTTDALERGRRHAFMRGARAFRTLTLGESVGVMSESVRLTADTELPDQVVVGAWDHETGRRVEVAFPPDAKPARGQTLRRLYQVAEGVAEPDALRRVAAAAWAATRQHQLELEVETWSPWSDGGSAGDPDLLACAPGAALGLLVADAYAAREAAAVEAAFDDLPALVLNALMAARRDPGAPAMLFQIGTLEHTYSAGAGSTEYSARLKLNTWLGRTQ